MSIASILNSSKVLFWHRMIQNYIIYKYFTLVKINIFASNSCEILHIFLTQSIKTYNFFKMFKNANQW